MKTTKQKVYRDRLNNHPVLRSHDGKIRCIAKYCECSKIKQWFKHQDHFCDKHGMQY